MAQTVHTFRAGELTVSVDSQANGAGPAYRLTIRDTAVTQPAYSLSIRPEDATKLSEMFQQAARLVEYLVCGLSYEVWREENDPTYDPERAEPE